MPVIFAENKKLSSTTILEAYCQFYRHSHNTFQINKARHDNVTRKRTISTKANLSRLRASYDGVISAVVGSEIRASVVARMKGNRWSVGLSNSPTTSVTNGSVSNLVTAVKGNASDAQFRQLED